MCLESTIEIANFCLVPEENSNVSKVEACKHDIILTTALTLILRGNVLNQRSTRFSSLERFYPHGRAVKLYLISGSSSKGDIFPSCTVTIDCDMLTSSIIYVLTSCPLRPAAAGHPFEPRAGQFITIGSETGSTRWPLGFWLKWRQSRRLLQSASCRAELRFRSCGEIDTLYLSPWPALWPWLPLPCQSAIGLNSGSRE